MTGTTPTPLERRFLRGVAAINPKSEYEGIWWSARGLRSTTVFGDFRDTSAASLAALGRACLAKGLVRTRYIGAPGHGWTEYQATSYGRGQVADSCIGGGLAWITYAGARICPACRTPASEIPRSLPAWDTIPAHPLPGYQPQAIL